MSDGVFTNEYRCKFVKGWRSVENGGGGEEDGIVECGHGTAYPMLVTPDQLAEILYRVKDSWFTSGSVSDVLGGSIAVYGSLAVGDPFVYGGGYEYRERSYGIQKIDPWDNGTYYFNNTYTSGIPDFAYAYDILDKEMALFQYDNGSIGINLETDEGLFHSEPFIEFNHDVYRYSYLTFRCGFSHIHNCESLPTATYGIYSYPDGTSANDSEKTKSLVIFSGRVAWVDVNGSNNPFDPNNKLYIGVEFSVMTAYDFGPPPVWIGTNKEYYNDPLGCNFVIELSNSSVSCPMYCDILGGFGASSDFIMTAQEWWPYSKNSPPTPVWSDTLGTKL